MSSVDQGRRQILAWGAAMAGVTLAPGVTLFDLAHGRAPTEPASSKVRWGMLVDLNQCASDCDACVSAAARRLTRAALDRAIAQAALADRIAKGVAHGEVWDQLTALGLKLAGGSKG